MSRVGHSVVCGRVRAQISVALDGELSQLERAIVARHVASCPDCSAYEAEASEFTRALREAPLERMTTSVVVRRPRRLTALRVPSAAAAALAIAVVGTAAQFAYQSADSGRGDTLAAPTRFQTQGELARELTLLEIASGGFRPGGARETVR